MHGLGSPLPLSSLVSSCPLLAGHSSWLFSLFGSGEVAELGRGEVGVGLEGRLHLLGHSAVLGSE